MVFRLCALLLAIFLTSCGGSSDSQDASTGTFTAPPVITLPGSTTTTQSTTTPATPPGFPVASDKYSVDYDDISETPASKAQTITLNGSVIKFTATAGELVAYEDATNPSFINAEAAISYTAYTRDDLPRDTRPVTFVFNGGPGGSAADLDLDFLGPKSFDEDAAQGPDLPLKDNPNTLLDKTDLVFVDPVGTGYSAAIWPNKNENYWGADSDAEVLRDFILRYINQNNRQSSPKYIYGVSYGGFRAPIIGRLLVESGASRYVPDPSGAPAKALSGLVLNSPMMNLTTDCYAFYASCGGNIPTYGLIADYQKAKASNAIPQPVTDARVKELATFADTFNTLYKTVFHGLDQPVPDPTLWDAYVQTNDGQDFVAKLAQITTIGLTGINPWIANPNMNAVDFGAAFDKVRGLLELGDGRVFLKAHTDDPAFDRTNIQLDFMKVYQAQFMGYTTPPAAPYLDLNGDIIGDWNYVPDPVISMTIGSNRQYNSIPDLAFSLVSASKPKVMIQHGYYDLNTPFYQTELNLKATGLTDTVPVSVYAGGHGVGPGATDSYEQVIQDLRAFYDPPPSKQLTASNATVTEGDGND